MIPPDYEVLLKKLRTTTEKGMRSWIETSDDQKFMMKVGLNSVSVRQSNYYDDDGDYLGDVVSFEVINQKGDTIDTFVTYWSDPEFQEMNNFYKMARRNALKIDKTISQLIQDLDLPF